MARKQFLHFGPFEFDPQTRLLRTNDELVSLEPMVARTLSVLVQAKGELVDKNDLIQEVWQGAFVTEASLSRNVSVLNSKLRRYLQGKKCIENHPKIGYRLLLTVTESWREVDELYSTTTGDGSQKELGGERQENSDRTAHIQNEEIGTRSGSESAMKKALHSPAERRKTWLAVLPVDNLTGDPGREYVSDGLTEEIISQLGSLNPSQLAVIARTSVMPYKHMRKTVAQIGHDLQVDYVLECSLRQWEDTVRINAQLITVHDQAQVWARTYQSSQHDLLKMQSEIANAVAKETSITFSSEQQTLAVPARPLDQRVHDLLLRGRYEWRERKNVRLKKAMQYFRQAIALDSQCAPAYANLANVYAVLPYYSDSSLRDTFQQAKAAAERALRLDETLWEAHTVLGLVECSYLNLEAGEREYQRALQLNPNYATAHHWRSFCLWMMNQPKEALNELETARRLDPLSWIIYADEALTFAADHQTDRAIQLLKTAVDSEPEFAETHRALSVAYVQKGEILQAVAEARRAVELDPNNCAQATLGYVYASAGKTAEAKRILAELADPARRPPVRPVYLSYIYIGLGDKDEALSCLERGYHDDSLLNALHAADAIFDPIRSDPRFLNLLHRRAIAAKSP